MNNERSRRWKPIKEKIETALRDGVYDNITHLADAIGLPIPTVRQWATTTTIPTLKNILVMEKFFGIVPGREERVNNITKLLGPSRHSRESISRKANLIAEHLEISLSLMKWFILDATEEERDILRHTLGTDLSYEAFNITRVLLTEAHFDKLVKGDGDGS